MFESETYIGGKVEAIEAGVFRADLPMRFKCKPSAYQVGIRLNDDRRKEMTCGCEIIIFGVIFVITKKRLCVMWVI